MIAAVAVVFRILNIVLNPKDGNIILIGQKFCHNIDIVHERADHTDSCNIIELFLNILLSKVVAKTLKFIIDTQRSFNAAFN